MRCGPNCSARQTSSWLWALARHVETAARTSAQRVARRVPVEGEVVVMRLPGSFISGLHAAPTCRRAVGVGPECATRLSCGGVFLQGGAYTLPSVAEMAAVECGAEIQRSAKGQVMQACGPERLWRCFGCPLLSTASARLAPGRFVRAVEKRSARSERFLAPIAMHRSQQYRRDPVRRCGAITCPRAAAPRGPASGRGRAPCRRYRPGMPAAPRARQNAPRSDSQSHLGRR